MSFPAFSAKIIVSALIRMNQGDHGGIVQMDSLRSGGGRSRKRDGVQAKVRQFQFGGDALSTDGN